MNPRVALFAGLLALVPVAHGQNAPHPDYVEGYQAWRDSRFPDASTRLSRFRLSELYARNYEVDYWLGTSWCRIQGRQPAGASLLDWGYRYGTMPEAARTKFHGELQACRTTSQAAPAVIEIASAPRATSRVQSKIFYVAGQRDGSGLLAPALRLTKPLTAEEYASRVFPIAELERARSATQARVPAAKVHAAGRLVVASLTPQHRERDLETIARRLEHFLAYLEREYDMTLPDAVITIYLVPDARTLVDLAAKTHGISAHPATLGYAFQNDLSVVGMLTGTAAGTLMHELFHLAVRARFGDIPQFLDEGMAALYETTFLKDEQYVAAPNWRGKVLQASRGMGVNLPLAKVITAPWFPDQPVDHPGLPRMGIEEQAYVLSSARYFMAWLQLQGKLPTVYRAFRDRTLPEDWVPADKQALDIVEAAAGAPIATLDKQYSAWLAQAILVPNGEPLPTPPTVRPAAGTPNSPGAGELIDKELPDSQ